MLVAKTPCIANATLLWSCFLFSFVCEIFHWHVLEIPGSLVWRCWVIQTGLQESESGCKSVLSGGPGVGSDTIAGGGVGVDGVGVCWEGRVVPTYLVRQRVFHRLTVFCATVYKPLVTYLRHKDSDVRDPVSHPVLKALVDLLNFLHLVRNQDQVVSPGKLCTVFFLPHFNLCIKKYKDG